MCFILVERRWSNVLRTSIKDLPIEWIQKVGEFIHELVIRARQLHSVAQLVRAVAQFVKVSERYCEQASQYTADFSTLLTELCNFIAIIWNIFIAEMSMVLSTCKATLLVIIQLCQRNSRRMDEYEREVRRNILRTLALKNYERTHSFERTLKTIILNSITDCLYLA